MGELVAHPITKGLLWGHKISVKGDKDLILLLNKFKNSLPENQDYLNGKDIINEFNIFLQTSAVKINRRILC